MAAASSEKFSSVYGVPVEILDSAAWVKGYTEDSDVERLASKLKLNYDATGDWGSALAKYENASFSEKVLETAGEGGNWFTKYGNLALGALADINPATSAVKKLAKTGEAVVENVGAPEWQTLFKSIGVVALGVVVIVLALLSYDKVRDVATVAITKGKK